MKKEKKDQLREQTLSTLSSLSQKEKQSIELQLMKQLVNSSLWKNANNIGITCSTKLEWDTFSIMERAWLDKKQVCVPITIPEQSKMEFYHINHRDELVVGYQHILEPNKNEQMLVTKQMIDLLIVPGVVFDEFGYRIGFGGGYYDRYLSDFSNTTVSLVSTLQLVHKLPIEKHDIHVQYLITEKGVHKAKEKSEV